MPRPEEPNSSQPVATERIQFLLSRHLDGDLTLDESSELTTLRQADSLRACLAAMADLRSQLKALPVKPVSDSFASSVHDAIHYPSKATLGASTPDPHRGWIMRGIVAVSVTACAMALMLFLQPPAPEASAPPTVAARNVNVQPEQMRVFIENDDWDIVVVQVHSRDRDAVMRDIEALVAQNGMDIRPVVGNDDHDNRFGILLTSTGVKDNVFINSVLSRTDAGSADWNAPSVADSTRESLIHSMQESLKVPTHSELHFGQVYMALPKLQQPPAAASQPLLADQASESDGSLSSAPAENRSEPTETSPETPAVRTTPVLVVFEFTDETPEHI